MVRGNELLNQFKKAQSQVRPAVEAVLDEAKRVAASESEYVSYDEIFGGEEQEWQRCVFCRQQPDLSKN